MLFYLLFIANYIPLSFKEMTLNNLILFLAARYTDRGNTIKYIFKKHFSHSHGLFFGHGHVDQTESIYYI